MANSQEIEKNAQADVAAVLAAASIERVQCEPVDLPDRATFVRVRCVNLRDALAGGTIPTGMYQADMAVECFSYSDDDRLGATLSTLVGSVRAAIWDSEILATLNSASTYHTYYGLLAGDSVPDTDGRYRILPLIFSLILKPEKADPEPDPEE